MLKWIAALPLGVREPPALVFKAADRHDINSVFPLIGIIADSCEYYFTQFGRESLPNLAENRYPIWLSFIT